jgi:hypothetical protein
LTDRGEYFNAKDAKGFGAGVRVVSNYRKGRREGGSLLSELDLHLSKCWHPDRSRLQTIAPAPQQHRSDRWRYLAGGIGILLTGLIGLATYQIFNSPEPSMAELDGLNLYLEAHILGDTGDPAVDVEKSEDLIDVDDELL